MRALFTGLILALVFNVHAQEATRNDVMQDEAIVLEQIRQDKVNAEAVEIAAARATVLATAATIDRAKTEDNAQRIEAAERLSASQNFTLQVLSIIMPLLTLVGTAAVGFMQIRSRGERQVLAQEQRSNLAAMAHSINGVKSELVAATQARAFYEARTLELERQLNPAAAGRVEARSAEVTAEVKRATANAVSVSDAVSIKLSPDEHLSHPGKAAGENES